jgi:hypothetical protein
MGACRKEHDPISLVIGQYIRFDWIPLSHASKCKCAILQSHKFNKNLLQSNYYVLFIYLFNILLHMLKDWGMTCKNLSAPIKIWILETFFIFNTLWRTGIMDSWWHTNILYCPLSDLIYMSKNLLFIFIYSIINGPNGTSYAPCINTTDCLVSPSYF